MSCWPDVDDDDVDDVDDKEVDDVDDDDDDDDDDEGDHDFVTKTPKTAFVYNSFFKFTGLISEAPFLRLFGEGICGSCGVV